MARTKQTLRIENQKKSLSRPPTDDKSTTKSNPETSTDSQVPQSDKMAKKLSKAGEKAQIPPKESDEGDSKESSLSPALTQPDQEEADEEKTHNTSKKRKRSAAAATSNELEAATTAEEEGLPSPEGKNPKLDEHTEGKPGKTTKKPALPKKTTRAQQSGQSNTATNVPPATTQNSSLAANATPNPSTAGASLGVPGIRDGFGVTTEDKRLMWAFKECNKDFWARVARGIVQLGGAEHTPEQCKERYEVLSRL